MEKLAFLVNDTDAAKAAVDTLHAADVDDEAISVIANDKTTLDELPNNAPEDDSDVLPAVARGVSIGGATGLIAGIAAITFAPAGLVIGGSALLAGATGGASFGAFAAALVGTSIPNSQLRAYENEVEAGRILMVVEIEDDRVDAVRQALEQASFKTDAFSTKHELPII